MSGWRAVLAKVRVCNGSKADSVGMVEKRTGGKVAWRPSNSAEWDQHLGAP